ARAAELGVQKMAGGIRASLARELHGGADSGRRLGNQSGGPAEKQRHGHHRRRSHTAPSARTASVTISMSPPSVVFFNRLSARSICSSAASSDADVHFFASPTQRFDSSS